MLLIHDVVNCANSTGKSMSDEETTPDLEQDLANQSKDDEKRRSALHARTRSELHEDDFEEKQAQPSSLAPVPENQPSKPRIMISGAELAGGYFNKHMVYVVTQQENKEIRRRYSDFHWLRTLVQVTHPALFVAPLPPKIPIVAFFSF
jgi:hypothetical protein